MKYTLRLKLVEALMKPERIEISKSVKRVILEGTL